MNARERRIEQIRQIAERAFKDHLLCDIVEEGNIRSYRVAKVGTGIYAFRVTFVPGFIHLYGDIGNVTYAPHRLNAFEWARSSCHNLDYLTGKIEPHDAGREFDGEVARADIDRYIKDAVDYGDNVKVLEEAKRAIDDGEFFMQQIMYDGMSDASELIGSCGYTYAVKAIWSHFALVKFFELLEQRENLVRPPESVVKGSKKDEGKHTGAPGAKA